MLSNIQKKIVKTLLPCRNDNSYLAGGLVLNRDNPRKSLDIDIFNDNLEVCRKSFEADMKVLQENNFTISNVVSKDYIFFATVSNGDSSTEIQWSVDSPFRFFPLEKDETLGFSLNKHDLAINKILAMAGRQAVRDYYDVCTLIANGDPVLAYIWAAPGKDPGYTPQLLMDALSWSSGYWRPEHFAEIDGCVLNFQDCKKMLLETFKTARELFPLAPIEEAGHIYLDPDTENPFWPSEEDFKDSRYLAHPGTLHGSIPQFVSDGPSP